MRRLAHLLAFASIACTTNEPAPARKAVGTKAQERTATEWQRTPEAEKAFAEYESWPEDVKRDVAAGVVRVGFTALQLRQARAWSKGGYKTPVAVVPNGEGQAWVYEDTTYIVAGGRVVRIQETLHFK